MSAAARFWTQAAEIADALACHDARHPDRPAEAGLPQDPTTPAANPLRAAAAETETQRGPSPVPPLRRGPTDLVRPVLPDGRVVPAARAGAGRISFTEVQR